MPCITYDCVPVDGRKYLEWVVDPVQVGSCLMYEKGPAQAGHAVAQCGINQVGEARCHGGQMLRMWARRLSKGTME